jgi:large subunit ribosomal protein L21e
MKSKGFRRKSRQVLKKKPRERGIQPLSRILHKYNSGDKVVVKIDSSIHGGMPHSRYHGKVGVVMKRRGQAYIVEMIEEGKIRELIVRPEHLIPYYDIGSE